jgi:hypothetical protein
VGSGILSAVVQVRWRKREWTGALRAGAVALRQRGGAGVGGGGGGEEGRGFLLFGVFVLVFVSLIPAEWSKKRGRREVGIAEKVRKGRAVGRVADVELVLSLPTVTAPAYV